MTNRKSTPRPQYPHTGFAPTVLKAFMLLVVLSLWEPCGFPQNIAVFKGNNPMDGATWVRMEISAAEPYLASAGQTFTPRIGVECHQRGKNRSFSILLDSGLLEAVGADAAFVKLPYGERLLRTKIGNDKPRWRAWKELTNGETYEYTGEGETGFGGVYKPSRFLRDMFSAERVLVEFQPYRWNGGFTAEFKMRGLREEFEKHQECELH
ncbi:MAG TPA: hypothetical protein VEV17_13905 [Bryobacteraceae bacterium]|nr:hypothetical protein [Bryobacteraceae bacterium]